MYKHSWIQNKQQNTIALKRLQQGAIFKQTSLERFASNSSTQNNSDSTLTPSWKQNIGHILLTRNVELLRRTLNELFHLLAARKLFLILLLNFLNRLLRCGDIQVGKNKESFPMLDVIRSEDRVVRRVWQNEPCTSYHMSYVRRSYNTFSLINWVQNINKQSNQITCVPTTMKLNLKFKTDPRSALAERKCGFKVIPLAFSDAKLTTEWHNRLNHKTTNLSLGNVTD